MANLDRRRAQLLMSEAGLDALLLFSPESFDYATGVSPGVATMWRRAGAVAVLVPADAGLSETAVVSDLFAKSFRTRSHIRDVRESPIWVETTTVEKIDPDLNANELIANAWKASGRQEGFSRPATFDPMVCFNHLADALSENGLSGGLVGFEASAVPANDYLLLRQGLPNIELIDASRIIAQLKMVKSHEEIDNLRQAVKLAEKGICAVRDGISENVTRNDLAAIWASAIKGHSAGIPLTGAWEYISIGSDPWGGNAPVRRGDLIKVDVGCLVNGYTSDSGRTFVLGAATKLQTEIFKALMQGFLAGSKLLRPGVALSDVHRETLSRIRSAGFYGYTRGHFGHGLGAGPGSEEWPFISADSNVVLEPDMVMAFECPWYINGLGGLIIENQVLITESGHEMMNELPIDLVEIAA